MSGLVRIGSSLIRQQQQQQQWRLLITPYNLTKTTTVGSLRFITTSKRNKDTSTLVGEPTITTTTTTTSQQQQSKNWVNWGFDIDSEQEDNTLMHLTFFFSVTLCIITTGFVWAYLPDYRMLDWAQREAFLQLRHREVEGLPLIDPNLVPLGNIDLPSDEDLGNTEVII
ncbi:hypothetical protein Pcinc_003841 [Petrolisthes cinctipes]|uniref:NADH dehydrogenase [ubiquinone] 1 beta subcomplex subunit 11, mitochondrial n=1 Tax=Petrolisthes cinctipes TaxID=88211 RepID=A0AAE1GII4_PETCI|nr:hypothetical protein Pcinc_003841 [Petrolisthes cinctipes]